MSLSRADLIRFALPLAGMALVLTACGSSNSTDEAEPAAATSVTAEVAEPEEMESEVAGSEEVAPAAGSFITFADYEGSKDTYAGNDVVLFFNASWCSTCKEARENLEADPSAIPAGLTIVKVDFDDSDELRQKYGVTVQHTFVQIDSDGNELAKWNGSVTADEIANQTT
jgi:thiol-disulfide isomerase/thioredoxin